MNFSHPSTRGVSGSFGANTNEQIYSKLTGKGPKMATTKNPAGNEYECLLDDVISDRSALYRSACVSPFSAMRGPKNLEKSGKIWKIWEQSRHGEWCLLDNITSLASLAHLRNKKTRKNSWCLC